MGAAVPLPIARTPFHNTHGAFFFNFNFYHVGGEVKASETKGPKQHWFSPPWMVFWGGGGGAESGMKRSHGWVLQMGALAISAGTATAMAIVASAFSHDHPNHVCRACLPTLLQGSWAPCVYIFPVLRSYFH